MEIKKSYVLTESLGNETFQFIVLEGTEGRKPVRTVMCDDVVYFSGTPEKFKCSIDPKWVYKARLQRRYKVVDAHMPVNTGDNERLTEWWKNSRYHIAKLLNYLREECPGSEDDENIMLHIRTAINVRFELGYRFYDFGTELIRWLKMGFCYDMDGALEQHNREHPKTEASDTNPSNASVASSGGSGSTIVGQGDKLSTDEKTERWKPISGWEDRYEVSTLGRVRSIHREYPKVSKYGVHYIQTVPQTVLKGHWGGGYHRVGLYRDGKSTVYSVHRLVAEAFIPNPENKPFVDHIDTDRSNNRVDNLRWVTQEENSNNPLSVEHNRMAQKQYSRL